MTDVIRVTDQFYILATHPTADQTKVLKHGDTFAVFDHHGDIQPVGLGEQGLYHGGTRYLSHWVLEFGGTRPLLLNSTVTEDNDILSVDLTNPDVYVHGRVLLPRGTLHLARSKLLWNGVCYEQLRIRNYGTASVHASFSYHFAADFADIFEVRGLSRERRGRLLAERYGESTVVLAYEGLDGVVRRTILEYGMTHALKLREVSHSGLYFDAELGPKEEAVFWLTVSCAVGDAVPQNLSYDGALTAVVEARERLRRPDCHVYTANEQFNEWLKRSQADLRMMLTETSQGLYPYAGVPWFSTVFGRDGIITAFEYLWVNPEIARGVLAYLAANQALEMNPEQDAEPGKVLHEVRSGEMAALGEVPFGRYYGSVDATPLFVVLAAAYYQRTGDRAFIEAIWPNIERALTWMEVYGDVDGDGFIEYVPRAARGLTNQGWKDSVDAVFHADGSLAQGPIALCEVQAYAYAARRGAAELAAMLGKDALAEALRAQAAELRQRFERAFWSEELGTYVLALDGEKRPCTVRTSNAGHALFAGIADAHRARTLAETLFREESFSGWGIRTVASDEVRYNPMSYHNGSIWPHDNALIGYGLANYGFKPLSHRLLTSLFDASLFMELHRVPELFCGFPRRPGQGPIRYPLACSPQAWAAAAVFLLLQASLGLSVEGAASRVVFSYPTLPEFLPSVEIRDLRVGNGSVDLIIERHDGDVAVRVLRREGDVGIVVVK